MSNRAPIARFNRGRDQGIDIEKADKLRTLTGISGYILARGQ
ncbi:MAG TPA: hypothetical protein VKX49_06005 [Bryobacteraceae bacterium]|nr:hypothetical protein [Bryobacteraceae bacterium]